MVEHEAEIQSRPARTWFQTSKEKGKAQGNITTLSFMIFVDITSVEISKQQYEAGFKLSQISQKGKGKDAGGEKVCRATHWPLNYALNDSSSRSGISSLASRAERRDEKSLWKKMQLRRVRLRPLSVLLRRASVQQKLARSSHRLNERGRTRIEEKQTASVSPPRTR